MWISLFIIIMAFIGFIIVVKELNNPIDVDCKSELF